MVTTTASASHDLTRIPATISDSMLDASPVADTMGAVSRYTLAQLASSGPDALVKLTYGVQVPRLPTPLLL